MIITLFPFLIEEKLECEVNGDVLTINGQTIDFSVIPEGYRISGSDVDNDWITHDYVYRKDGQINLTIKFPVYIDSPKGVRSPETPTVIKVNSGKVFFPDITPEVKDVN